MSLYSDDGIFGNLNYGCPGPSRGLAFGTYVYQTVYNGLENKRICVIGAGVGYEIALFDSLGIDVTGVDIYEQKGSFINSYSLVFIFSCRARGGR